MKTKLHILAVFIVSTNFLLDVNSNTKTLDLRNYSDGLCNLNSSYNSHYIHQLFD